MNYSDHGYRINQVTTGSGFNWLFLPGGPGLGSEYLIDFCKKLKLPGSITLLDFPKDGTNTQGKLDFKYWQDGIIALMKSYANPVLVTHSFSGMFALNMPELEDLLSGIVFMNTTTANSFFEHVNAMHQLHHLPDLVPAASEYHLSPSNKAYRTFWDTYKYYCFTPDELDIGEKMMDLFAYNNESYHYAIEHFYPDFYCKWSPETIPVMTIASELDFICPPDIFIRNKQFQKKNIINKVILKAGHCPWIIHKDQIQICFDEFIERL